MDVEMPENCTCFNLRKAARAVTRAYDEALKPSGLRATQFSLLSVVANRGPAGMTELAQALVMERTTLTRNLKPLMEQGFLEVVDGADKRRRPIAVTPRGRQALDKALPLWRRAQAKFADGLGRSRWQDLLRGLEEAVKQAG
jgi:DNA-binding MarR family transcriptional regulator